MSSILDSVDQRTQLAGHNRLELLMFKLNGRQRFGINVFKVQEVIMCPPLTQLPKAHSVVIGVANMRGRTIPVMDLSQAIGKSPIKDPRSSYVVVTEFNRKVQGFLVGGVDRIVNMNWSDILPPPSGVSAASYVTAVTNIDNELVEIIDVEKVLSEVLGQVADVSEDLIKRSLAKDQRKYHILVADDSSVARNQIKRTLTQLDIECTLANDGQQALDKLKEWADSGQPLNEIVDLIISDVEMPEMDGYTLTTEIRKDPRMKDVFIILHTSLSGVFNTKMVESVGADKFIPKFNADELASVVLEELGIHQEEQQAVS